MDRSGRLALSLAFASHNDEEALELAAVEAEGCDAELWQGSRVVGRLYATPALVPEAFRKRNSRPGAGYSAE
jgi:hypothetical protein